jgi:VanZ family protein
VLWRARIVLSAYKITMTVYKIVTRLPLLLVVGLIWFLSSQSTLPQPKGILGFDKFQHLFAYLVLAVALGLWFPSRHWQFHRLRTLLLIVLITSAYGAADEIHQYYVPGRDCNVWDWLADAIGAVFGAPAVMLSDRHILARIRAKIE